MHISFGKRAWVLLGLAAAIIAGCAAAFLWWGVGAPQGAIQDYSEKRDKEMIVRAFQNDFYWLSANPDFDVIHMLTTHSPNKEPEYQGALNIKVLVDHGKPAAFVTYYKRSFYEGLLLFLYVSNDFRGKGYGQKLVRYTIDELFDQGCTLVRLVTRTTNTWARAIYKKMGFQEFERTDGFVDYLMTR